MINQTELVDGSAISSPCTPLSVDSSVSRLVNLVNENVHVYGRVVKLSFKGHLHGRE